MSTNLGFQDESENEHYLNIGLICNLPLLRAVPEVETNKTLAFNKLFEVFP